MSALQDLRRTVARLRAPGGCPWDQEQTHESLCQFLIEETAELLDTIDQRDFEHMREELGDVLLQVVLHAQIAEEEGHFDLEAVAAEINEKLIRRHPHVFGDAELQTSEQVLVKWEEIKAAEKQGKPEVNTVLKELPASLPALLFARDLYKQLAKKNINVNHKVDESRISDISSGLTEETAGKLLFEMSAACRKASIDPESALRRYAKKIIEEVEANRLP